MNKHFCVRDFHNKIKHNFYFRFYFKTAGSFGIKAFNWLLTDFNSKQSNVSFSLKFRKEQGTSIKAKHNKSAQLINLKVSTKIPHESILKLLNYRILTTDILTFQDLIIKMLSL